MSNRDNELYAELRGILSGKVKKPITHKHEGAVKRVHARFLEGGYINEQDTLQKSI
mgnify:CR=1 FL=1